MERHTLRLGAVLALSAFVMGAQMVRPASALASCSASDLCAALAQINANCNCQTASSHAAYVQCAKAAVTNKSCRGKATKCAAKSTCGTSRVKCCRTTAKGKVKCSIKSQSAKCKPPKGGSAHTGNGSCCGAGCGGSVGGAFTGCSPSGAFTEVSAGLF